MQKALALAYADVESSGARIYAADKVARLWISCICATKGVR